MGERSEDKPANLIGWEIEAWDIPLANPVVGQTAVNHRALLRTISEERSKTEAIRRDVRALEKRLSGLTRDLEGGRYR